MTLCVPSLRRYDSFSFDITDALTRHGQHELIVRVLDPTDHAHIPLGKQRANPDPKGIVYQGTAGIWQTVWIEPVLCASSRSSRDEQWTWPSVSQSSWP
jgi:hypothetical protein